MGFALFESMAQHSKEAIPNSIQIQRSNVIEEYPCVFSRGLGSGVEEEPPWRSGFFAGPGPPALVGGKTPPLGEQEGHCSGVHPLGPSLI